MTARNPNVFYEVGYAHALGKTVVLLTQRADDIPFDLKHFPHIVYGDQIKELRAELAKRVRHFAFEVETPTESQFGIDLYLGNTSLSLGNAVRQYHASVWPEAKISIFNSSTRTYAPGDFRLGIIAPPPYGSALTEGAAVTPLPDGTYLHMLPEFETLFPGAFTSVSFRIGSIEKESPSPFNVTLRVFSSAGYRDFPLRMEEING